MLDRVEQKLFLEAEKPESVTQGLRLAHRLEALHSLIGMDETASLVGYFLV